MPLCDVITVKSHFLLEGNLLLVMLPPMTLFTEKGRLGGRERKKRHVKHWGLPALISSSQ